MDESQYFGVVDHIKLPQSLSNELGYLCALPGAAHIIMFGGRDLESPTTDPIALFYHNGTRKYLWRDKYWAECDLPAAPITYTLTKMLETIRDNQDLVTDVQRVLNLIKYYRTNFGPTLIEPLSTDLNKMFCRAIYQISG